MRNTRADNFTRITSGEVGVASELPFWRLETYYTAILMLTREIDRKRREQAKNANK